jgi:hypothetical protein
MTRCEVARAGRYVPAEREQSFLDTIENPRYDRDIINGLKPFFQDKAPEDIKAFYSPDELAVLSSLTGTPRDVEARMPVKMTRHFFEMARNSLPLQRLVKASPDETLSLAGSEDPGYQMDFAPVEGMLHKYEMGLLYAVSTCSAHCRFCYREELISQKDIERQDGTVAKKGLAKIKEVTDYVRAHNETVSANGGVHPQTCCRTGRSEPGWPPWPNPALNPSAWAPRKCHFTPNGSMTPSWPCWTTFTRPTPMSVSG